MEHLGVVGLQGAGANRLFSALTGLDSPSEFDSAVGVATVPDARLDRLAAMSASAKVVPAHFELVHLALPPGATPGEGLGARLLGAIRTCDAVLFVLASGAGADPVADLAALELEMVMADLTTVEGRHDRQRRAAKGDKSLLPELAALERAQATLEAGVPIRRSDLTADERVLLEPCFLLTVKPGIVVLNTGDRPEPPADLASAEELGGLDVVPVPVDLEAEIAAMEPDDRAEIRAGYGVEEPALDRVAHAAYGLLGRRTFFTTGDKESRAWTFRDGETAPECAGVIHSDLQRGFIRAEVIGWEELLEIGSWSKARDIGRLRVEGKDYRVVDGDVVEIRFNV